MHSGRVGRGGGGGVMEDEGSHAPVTTHTQNMPRSSTSFNSRKVQSLPGHYSRSNHPPQTFRDAFNTSRSPTPNQRSDLPTVLSRPDASPVHNRKPVAVQNLPQETVKTNQDEKKSKRSILGSFFRRKKKDAESSSSSDSSSEVEEPLQKRMFFRRRRRKKEQQSSSLQNDSPSSVASKVGNKTNFVVSTSNISDIPTSHSKITTQPLGIPVIPNPGQLSKTGFSISHGSLPASTAPGGSFTSLNSSYSNPLTGMGFRSSSTDTLSRKERREALKARVEKLRDKFRESSSEDEKHSFSSHSFHGSESSLNKTNSLNNRSKSSRTERYIRRKSQELETLRAETEKDKRNREAVQARIHEIQKFQQYEAERNKINNDKNVKDIKQKHKWSAKMVYQETSECDSSVVLRTPSLSPAGSPYLNNKQHHSKSYLQSETGNILSSSSNFKISGDSNTLKNLQSHEALMYGGLRNHRSASYDSNINRTSQLPKSSPSRNSGLPPVNRAGVTPPPPPPRDSSRILSPGDAHRPMSYSFESLHQDTSRPPSNISSLSNFTKGTSPSPSMISVPPSLSMKQNGNFPDHHEISQSRKSFPEHLYHQEFSSQYIMPQRPAHPDSNFNQSLNGQNLMSQQNLYHRNIVAPSTQANQTQMFLQDQQNLKIEDTSHYAKIIPIGSVPPSPSSDYSSYVSDNSIKIQKANSSWKNKEQDTKVKNSNLQVFNSHMLSDSSRSSSPKTEVTIQSKSEMSSNLQAKKRPQPLTLKQAESISSLSGQSDVSSPVPKNSVEKAGDSDSSQNSLNRDKKKPVNTRPLSMVLEKAESADKDSNNFGVSQPQPPKRNLQMNAGCLENAKKQMEDIVKNKTELNSTRNLRKKEFENMYIKEKERLEKTKCVDFEEALKELEDLYNSLKLDSDDILEGAEKREISSIQQMRDSSFESDIGFDGDGILCDRGRPKTPKSRRSSIPDKTTDDMHYRRCQQNARNQPDVDKALQMTGSYLLMSPAHTVPSDIDDDIKDPKMRDEPDIIYDDVTYRNLKHANSIKIIDPQPPFGIPLGPTTQASSNDYLHLTVNENQKPALSLRNEPDPAKDDLAYRNLRKDKQNGSNNAVNTSELDELLSEVGQIPNKNRRAIRSMSADRSRSYQFEFENDLDPTSMKMKPIKTQTPRRVKQQNEARRAGKFFDSYRDSQLENDGYSSAGINPRNNPSWLERAQLNDSRWDNMSTSTETLTEISSVKAVSQPDIRQAIIREAKAPSGGPFDFSTKYIESRSVDDTNASSSSLSPQLVKIQSIQSPLTAPILIEKKPYRPLDSIFNNKPKPFYIKSTSQKQEDQHVDIAKLDALISSLSKMESNIDDNSDKSSDTLISPTLSPEKELSKITCDTKPEPLYENTKDLIESYNRDSQERIQSPELKNAKENIQKAIRLSMAMESSNSEGNWLSSRRFSAVELPVQSSHSTVNTLSSSILSTQTVPFSNGHIPGPCSPERVIISDTSTMPRAYKASTCTNKVESMVVVSECVHGRGRRAKSVPTSPRQSLRFSLITKELAELKNIQIPDSTSSSQTLIDDNYSTSSTIDLNSVKDFNDENINSNFKQDGTNNLLYNQYDVISSNLESSNLSDSKTKCELKSPQIVKHAVSLHENQSSLDTSLRNMLDLCKDIKSKPPTSFTLPRNAPPPPSRSSSLPPVIQDINAQILKTDFSEPESQNTSMPRIRRRWSVVSSSSSSDSNEELLGSTAHHHRRRHSSSPSPQIGADPRPCSEGEGAVCDPELSSISLNTPYGEQILTVCYIIACITQLVGIDFLAAFGLILAMASVFVTFAT